MSKAEQTGRVGIFWMSRDGKKRYIKSVALDDADYVEGFYDYKGAHDQEWRQVTTKYPEWEDLEYFEIPRGRVVMINHGDGCEYVVYLPLVLKRFERQIADSFNLHLVSTRFDYSDEHYSVN